MLVLILKQKLKYPLALDNEVNLQQQKQFPGGKEQEGGVTKTQENTFGGG